MRSLPLTAMTLLVLGATGACGDDDAPPPTDSGAPSDSGRRRDAGAPFDAGPPGPCGPPVFPDGTTLRRKPYLQSVTATSAIVAWTTTGGGRGVLRLAPDPAGPWTEVEAGAELFAVGRTGDSEDYTAYDARATALVPGSAYCYELVEDGVTLASGLELGTAWEDGSRPLRLLAVGDSGSGSVFQTLLRDQMLRHEYDLFLHLGDMAYSDGEFTEFERNMFGVYADILHAIPQWPAIGNHEYHTGEGQPYLDVYYLFEQAMRAQDQERYYAFDWGGVHFVSLDSNSEMLGTVDDTSTDDMVDWLRADLAASTSTWKIAFFHHPAWSSGSHGSSSRVQELIVPALEEGGIDLVLVGHDHHYERTVPIVGGAAAMMGDLSAITYVVAGAGGAGLRVAPGDWFTAFVEDETFSFLLFDIDGCTGRGRAIDIEGNEIDSFEIDGCEG